MCRLVNAAGPQLLLQRLFSHFGFSLCGVVQLRSVLVWYVSYCEASETRSDVAAAQNASLFHLISPQHLRLPAAGNQLSQCSDCLALDTVWVSIKLLHTFFSLWWKKECARECNASLKKKTQKTFTLLFFVHKIKNFHSFPISVHILVLCAACTTGHLVSKSHSCLSDAPVFLNLILYSLNQFPSHLHSLFVDGTTLPPPGRLTDVSFFHYQFNFLFFNPS